MNQGDINEPGNGWRTLIATLLWIGLGVLFATEWTGSFWTTMFNILIFKWVWGAWI